MLVKKTKKLKSKSLFKTLEDIGRKLSDLRIEKGYKTIKEFAAYYKLPLIQYWKIEKGKSNITLRSLIVLLTIHQLTIEDFFCK